MRPAARKHDEEESVPWEIIKEARKWGLHGIDHLQRLAADNDGQFSVIYAEELHWGCAGIALAIQASSLAAAHLTLVPELKAALVKEGRDDIMIVVGGVVPPQDYDALKRAGAEAIFPPGTVIAEAAEALIHKLNQRLGHGRAAAE